MVCMKLHSIYSLGEHRSSIKVMDLPLFFIILCIICSCVSQSLSKKLTVWPNSQFLSTELTLVYKCRINYLRLKEKAHVRADLILVGL